MHFLSLASLALVATGASAIVVPRNHIHHARHSAEKPDTYYEGYLEKYATYHTRYLALGCENEHGKPFFDACCHPMLATETLEKNRAPECNPANHVSSAVSSAVQTSTAQPAATQVLSTGGDDDDEDCDDEDDEPTSSASSAAPTSTSDDDDDEDCEDEDESSTPVAQPTTHAASSSSEAPAKTSTQAPVTTSTHSEAPSTTPTPTKSTASSTKATASPTPTSGSGNSDNETFDGNATFYYQNGQAGACGNKNPDSAFIAAMQTERYGDLSRQSSLCGKKVQITNTKNGKSVTVTIADACPTCGGPNDIDLSEGAFTQIATKDEGEVPISWKFV